jgi:hypothetical protein
MTRREFRGSILLFGIGLSQVVTVPVIAGSTPTATALFSSQNSATLGQPVTLTAAVSPSTASGEMTLYDGTTIVGTIPLEAGQAALYTSLLGFGVYSLKVSGVRLKVFSQRFHTE